MRIDRLVIDAFLSAILAYWNHHKVVRSNSGLGADCIDIVGGYFVLTVRVDYYESNTDLQVVLEQLSWALVDQKQFNIFDTEKMYCLTFQKS